MTMGLISSGGGLDKSRSRSNGGVGSVARCLGVNNLDEDLTIGLSKIAETSNCFPTTSKDFGAMPAAVSYESI